jgi:hypothetical protein
VIQAVTPYGRAAGSSRVRVFEWLTRTSAPSIVQSYLGRLNASPAYMATHPLSVLRAEAALRRVAQRRPERLLLHREASPISRGSLEVRLIKRAELAVYDFDDALQWDDGSDSRLRRLFPKAPKALAAVRAADRVIAGNAVLAEWASAHNSDVRIIPSCVAPSTYRQRTHYELHDPPRLGWIGSTDNEPLLGLIAEALFEINRRTGARLTLIGTTEPTLGPLEGIIDRVPWSERIQEVGLADIDVGLMPVPDTPYNRGKCGYKLLQYAAAGILLAGSPVGVNSEILARIGMPAPTSLAEWVDAILSLLSMPAAERQRLGSQARKVAELHYSYDAWLPDWEEAVGLREAREAAATGSESG